MLSRRAFTPTVGAPFFPTAGDIKRTEKNVSWLGRKANQAIDRNSFTVFNSTKKQHNYSLLFDR